MGLPPLLRSALRRGKSSGVLPRLVSSCRIAGGNVLSPTMASADSCPVTATVASGRATLVGWHAGQVSPDKNVNCGYTTAAFTISPESVGLRHVVLTCPDYGLVCCFCSSAHSFALGLPPDPSSRRRPCRRLVLLPRHHDGAGFKYRGLAPHKFTPMTGVHHEWKVRQT